MSTEAAAIEQCFIALQSSTSAASADDAVASLKRLFREHPESIVNEKWIPFFQAGVSSPHLCTATASVLVQSVAVEGCYALWLSSGLWSYLLDTIAHTNAACGCAAVSAIAAAVSHRFAQGDDGVITGTTRETLLDVSSRSESAKLRVVDLAIRVGAQHEALVVPCEPLYELVVDMIVGDDLLAQMAAFEQLECIAKRLPKGMGVSLLSKHNVIAKTVQLFTSDTSLLEQQCARFLGAVASTGTIGFTTLASHEYLAPLQQRLDEGDRSHQDAALTAVRGIAIGCAEGLQALIDENVHTKVASLVVSPDSVIRLSALHSLEGFLQCPNMTSAQSDCLHQALKGIPTPSTFMEYVMSRLTLPLPDERMAFLRFMTTVAGCVAWGPSMSFQHPGFLPYVLNRSTEHTKMGCEWKYALVEALVVRNRSATESALPDPSAFVSLLTYVKEGVYKGNPSQSQVAVGERTGA